MKRCSFCEWIPILPIPVWPLAWQCSWGQNTVVGSMTLLLAMRGNMTTRSMSGPRLLYNVTAPRLGGELSGDIALAHRLQGRQVPQRPGRYARPAECARLRDSPETGVAGRARQRARDAVALAPVPA